MLKSEDVLKGLTKPQREAATHIDGPLLVLAGAGSGKTRTITRRVAYMVSCGIPAQNILAITFTNKAAGEMRERIRDLLGGAGAQGRGVNVLTFHALGARIVRDYADLLNLPASFT
ncbi:MAG: UvrD-helicase domain-containing protein, partial [Phycisphaerae bacterium]